MNEKELNEFLQKGLKASEVERLAGRKATATAILQITSLIALRFLPATHKVICMSCKKQIKNGMEVEFWKATGTCYSCDKAYVEVMEDQIYG